MTKRTLFVLSTTLFVLVMACNTFFTPNTSKHIEGDWVRVPIDTMEIIWSYKDGKLTIKDGPHQGEYTYQVIEKSKTDYVKIFESDNSLFMETADRWQVIEAGKEELYMISEKDTEEGGTIEGAVTLEFARK